MSTSFLDNLHQGYQRASFIGSFVQKTTTWEARCVLESFYEAIMNGTLAMIHPTPGSSLPEDYVNGAVKIIDEEWEKEHRQRGTGFTGGPGFSELAYPQKLALVQSLRRALGKNPLAIDSEYYTGC